MIENKEACREQSDWSRIALASIGDAVIVTDAAGLVTFLNPIAQSLTGWSQEEAAGKPLPAVFRIVNEHTHQVVEDPAAKVLDRDGIVGMASNTVLIARNGSERPIDDSGAPIRDADGKIVGIVLIFRDVTETRRVARIAENALAYAEGIVESVRDPLLVLDASLRVRKANRSYYQTFHVTPAETNNKLLYDVGNGQWNLPQLRRLMAEILPSDSHFNDFEVDHDFKKIGRRTMLLNARRVHREVDETELILLVIQDVTERVRAAHAVRVSETRYRRLFETAQDGILILDADRRQILDANPFLMDMLGYSLAELVGKELWQIGLFRDIEANKAAFATLQETGYIRYEDLPLKTRDGRHIDVEFVSNVYRVDRQRIIQCNIRDVTERKRAEHALREAYGQLEIHVEERTVELARANECLRAEIVGHKKSEAARQALLQRLVTAQEEERHRIARELHDQMGQYLAALILGLKVLKDATPEHSPEHRRLQRLQEIADLIGKEVHHLALELRPTALDDLGLETTLVNHVEEWSERSGVKVDFHSSGLEKRRLLAAIETALYRIVQEGLTNVLKHAKALHVSVILQRSSDQVSVIIEDDGQGFIVEPVPGPSAVNRHLGLLGMEERGAMVGGTLTVESTLGKGTTVFVRIPMSEDEEDDDDTD
jgi:PAS domain S-box-containing protein